MTLIEVAPLRFSTPLDDFLRLRTWPVPADIGGGDAEPFEIDSCVSQGVLQGRTFERDEPEGDIASNETLLLNLVHEGAKPFKTMWFFGGRTWMSENPTACVHFEHRRYRSKRGACRLELSQGV